MELPNGRELELQGMLLAEAKKLLGGTEGDDFSKDAEDVAGDALIKLIEYKDNDGDAFNLGKTIVHNLAKNHMRDERRRAELRRENGEQIATSTCANWSGDDPAQIVEAEERLEQMNKLSPILRSAFLRYVVEGRSYAELATAEDTTEAVIRKRVQRAKEELGA
jgi:RNA polymerase sigma factor (sigma-70 family)